MSTCNFTTQTNFDFYVWDYYLTDEEVKDFIITNDYEEPENITQSIIDDWTIEIYNKEYESTVDYFNYVLPSILKKYKRELKFFDVVLKDGYYSGLQFYVEPQENLDDFFYGLDRREFEDWITDVTNDDTQYYFNECRSIIVRQIRSEINFINKKLLPKLARKLGFQGARLVGVFSNGEGVYEYV